MPNWTAAGRNADAVLASLGRALAIVEFDPDGTVLNANANFCTAMGYERADVIGQHHRMFVAPEEAASSAYATFWRNLAAGTFARGEFRRIGKGGREVWIQASYDPVPGRSGKISRIVKVANVVTEEKRKSLEAAAKLNAISLVQAIIEFTPSGEILVANDNFLSLMGYELDEIRGRHHRMFVEPSYAASREYIAFWDKLNRGEFAAASFKRLARGGRELWIQASYNPLFDATGRVVKVIKFANDITDLTRLAQGLERLAQNTLNEPIDDPFAPTFDKLRDDFNTAQRHLCSTLQKIAERVTVAQSNMDSITTGADDLSRRTEQQAASLEETAAALDQITATVRHSAEGAAEARTLVETADAESNRSADVMREAVEAMSHIRGSSGAIAKIIGVIDEIAFQTNLLALNAGVEAARAGDAGRGFMVVASEVRALAQRSAEAAREIKDLISASERHVALGARLVDDTGACLERIRARVSDLNRIIGDIAGGAREQAKGLQEINTAVNAMDKVTQQNAGLVADTHAASQTLLAELDEVSTLITAFRLAEHESGASDASIAPRPLRVAANGRR